MNLYLLLEIFMLKLEKDDIIYFLNKKVCVFHIKGFRYNGTVKNVGSSCILLDDRYDGMMTIKYEDIDRVKEATW